MKREQRIAHGLGGEFADLKLAVEFHLALGGMNVHVHGGGINFEKQAADRVAAFHQRRVVAFDERVVKPAIFDRAAIDEQMLTLSRRSRYAGRAGQTPNADLRFWI